MNPRNIVAAALLVIVALWVAVQLDRAASTITAKLEAIASTSKLAHDAARRRYGRI